MQFSYEEVSNYIAFSQLLAHLIREEKLNTAMPITKYLENCDRMLPHDAVLNQKFWWPLPELGEYTALEIIKDIESRAAHILEKSEYMRKVMDFIIARASGENPTNARQIRDFLRNHEDYKNDSKITERMEYDLLMWIREK